MLYREALIGLYARHPVREVKELAGYAALQAEHGAAPGFQALRDEVERIKTSVEVRFAGAVSEADQLKAAIRLLKGTRSDERKGQLCYELILAGFGERWSAERRDYLAIVLEAVRLKRDYFMSYTTRYLAPGEVNPVNHDYRHFIADVLARPLRETNQRTNLLAQAIHKIFARHAEGFLFELSQYDNAVTEAKLEQAVAESMVFVQLVQLVMFKPDPKQRPNYCYWEWQGAKKRFGERQEHLLYLVAEPSREMLAQADPFIDYTDWHTDVVKRDPPYLPLHRTLSRVQIEETKRMLERFAEQHIAGAWVRLEQAAP